MVDQALSVVAVLVFMVLGVWWVVRSRRDPLAGAPQRANDVREDALALVVMIYLLGFCLLLPCAAPGFELIFPDSTKGPPMPLPPVFEACHSNPLDLNGTGISSEIMADFGLESEVADDFVMEYDREILRARWWGTCW